MDAKGDIFDAAEVRRSVKREEVDAQEGLGREPKEQNRGSWCCRSHVGMKGGGAHAQKHKKSCATITIYSTLLEVQVEKMIRTVAEMTGELRNHFIATTMSMRNAGPCSAKEDQA